MTNSNEEMEIKVFIENVYGNKTIYPACKKSNIFAKMLNQKTLTKRDISCISELGYTILPTLKDSKII